MRQLFNGAKLLAARKKIGMSRMTLSRKIGHRIGHQSILAYEMYGQEPTASTVYAMARVLGVKVEDFMDDICLE